MTKLLDGKTAVVTGASEGIGRACVEAYVAEGARVVAVSSNADKLNAAFNKHGGAVITVAANLLDDAQCDALLPTILGKVSCIDIFHANAGLYVGGNLVDNEKARIRDVLKLNTTVPIVNVRDVLPHMIERKTGDIIITSSLAAHFPTSVEPVYAPSKRAIREFVDIMSEQVRTTGVRIGMISPGPTQTAMTNDWSPERLQHALDTGGMVTAAQVADNAVYMLTRGRNMNLRDMVSRPTEFDIYRV